MTEVIIALLLVLTCSACFSASETGMMALNRYHLDAWVASGSSRAGLIKQLLDRPDRLLGIILIGNTLANNLAVALLNIVVGDRYGSLGVMMATVALTLFMLVFVEVMPKTFAAFRPKYVAMWMVWPLKILLTFLYPLVAGVNAVANGCLGWLGMRIEQGVGDEPMGPEGLRGLLGSMSPRHRHMLFGVLDLDQIKVEEVMVPRRDLVVLDIQCLWSDLMAVIQQSRRHQWLVVDGSLDCVLGVISLHGLLRLVNGNQGHVEGLRKALEPVCYTPEGITLHQQLAAFQKNKHTMALVVDEYGEILGMVGLHDIVEEIIGHYAQSARAPVHLEAQSDGSYRLSADVNIRDLNRRLDWQLPVGGPNSTLGGIIVEHLEGLPSGPVCLLLANHPIEVASLRERGIDVVKIWPQVKVQLESS